MDFFSPTKPSVTPHFLWIREIANLFLCYLRCSTIWAHTQRTCLIPGTRASQPATQRIPVFSCYVLDCYVIHSHSACFWKLVFLGDACEVGCLGNCQLLHSSGRIRMQPWETYISFLASPLKRDAVTVSGLTRCRDAGKGRRGLQIHWFPLFLAVTLNEILHFPPFQEEGHAPLFLGNPGDLVTICLWAL